MRVNLAALMVFALLLAALSWMVAAPFWAYLVLGLVLATICYPLHARIEDKLGQPRVAAAITISAATTLILLPLGFVAWKIVLDIQNLATSVTVPEVAGALQGALVWSHHAVGYPQNLDPGMGMALVERLIPELKARASDWAVSAVTSLATFLLGLTLTVIVMFYALVDGPDFVERLKSASPMDDQLEASFLEEAKGTIEGVVWGQLVTALLQGGLGLAAFLVVGLPSPFFWGFMMAILSFVPVVGAFLVWFPAALYLISAGEIGLGIGLLVWGVGVISTVDNVVKPFIIGRRGRVHSLLAFVGVLGGLAAFGFLGFLIGPLVLSLAAAVFNVLVETDWDRVDRGEPARTPVPQAEKADVGGAPDAGDAAGDATGA